MRIFKFMIVSLLGVTITLTANNSWSNENITTDSSSLQSIDSTSSANRFWNIGKEANEAINSSKLLRFTIEKTNSDNDFLELLEPEDTDDKQEELNSNYGDTPTKGTTIPLVQF